MSGMSLHPLSLATSGSIEGFTNNYNPGMLGGWASDNPQGDSKILGFWNGNQILTSLWTGYTGNSNSPTIVFGEPVDFMGGTNSYYPTVDPAVPGFTNNFNPVFIS